MRESLRIAAIFCSMALWSVADAQGRAFVISHRVCDMGAQQAPPLIPIGCELVDPALGCPPAQSLSVKLSFEAPEGSTAKLTFTNAPAGLQASSDGTATRSTASTVSMSPGSGVLTGFTSDAATAPMVTIDVTVPSLQGMPNPWLSGPESAALVKMQLTQAVDKYVVDQTSIRHYYYPCQPPDEKDKITLVGPSSGSVALLDAKVEAHCGDPYEDYLGKSVIALPNLKTKGTCLERVMLFSGGAALEFRRDSAVWHDSPEDNLKIDLHRLALQPVKIWVLFDPCRTLHAPNDSCVGSPQEWEKRPERHLQMAMRIYDDQYSGITFNVVGQRDLTREREIRDLREFVDNSRLRCYDAASTKLTLEKLRAFTQQTSTEYSKHLNVFYVNDPAGHGLWCGSYDAYDQARNGRDTILLGITAKPATLAHELGHALLQTGNHSDVNDHFGPAHSGNLMTYSVNGEQLTLGQLFRANLHSQSPVNRHNARPGLPTADCAADPPADGCPEPSRDVRPR